MSRIGQLEEVCEEVVVVEATERASLPSRSPERLSLLAF